MGERKGKSTLVHREEILELSGVGATLREALGAFFPKFRVPPVARMTKY